MCESLTLLMIKDYKFRVPGDTLQGDDESVSGRKSNRERETLYVLHCTKY